MTAATSAARPTLRGKGYRPEASAAKLIRSTYLGESRGYGNRVSVPLENSSSRNLKANRSENVLQK